MATIRRRGDRWQVQVRRKGCTSATRSFLKRADAEAWARQTELEADRRGLPANRKRLETVALGEVLARYRDEVVPRKRGKLNETLAINAFLRHRIAKLPLSVLTAAHVAAYRDERLRTVKPTTLNRQLDIFRHALEVATQEWGLVLSVNPFAAVKRPKTADSRQRRLKPGELDRLAAACRQCRGPFLLLMVELALETAMRRGELLNARWRDVDLGSRTLHIPKTKNDHPRTIPLTARAIAVLERLKEVGEGCDSVVPLSLESMKMAWKRALRRSGIENFRFHDLRHEAVSRFFEFGLSIPEVALISGHRDLRMLFRYTHPNPELIAEKLARMADGLE